MFRVGLVTKKKKLICVHARYVVGVLSPSKKMSACRKKPVKSSLPIFNTDFTGSDLRGVDFTATRLENINFQGTNLDPKDFQEADCRKCTFDRPENVR